MVQMRKSPEREQTQPIGAAQKPTVFLAGSIEMGKARLWHNVVAEALAERDIILYNPRRDDWDSSWEQSIQNYEFREQVTWELDYIQQSNIVFFNFEADTISPITLLELGLVAGESPQKAIVVCPKGYFRRGNVEILCYRCGIPLFDDLETGIEFLKTAV